MRIESITLREIQLALKEPFQISSGTVTHRRILLLQVRSAEGIEAWSECVAGEQPNYGPETIDLAWVAIREYVAPRVLGRDFAGPEEIQPALDENFRGSNMAKAAIEMAAWDLAARAEKISLARKLGGTRDRIQVGISLGIQKSPEALVERARTALERGYKKVKIKIKPGQDVEYVRAVREALGPDAPLMADANNAYTLDDMPSLTELDGLGLMMIEQPLAWDDILRHADLQRQLKTPICLDESITSLDRAQDMIDLGSGRIINIKPGRVGGFRASKAIHDLCAAHGIPVWCGGMLESGVGRAHNVALASLPNFTLPGDLSPSERYWEKDVVIPEWTMDREGWMDVPVDKPGIGVEVDLNRVDDLTLRREELGSK
ncbi:MAG: o-succinylbenzoate synthase [Acidobacteriota bacterium]|jgi:O-succinylbenzoate synthase|nr:o-succinylbenzoate synthase [Acidobacteriota bacterium]